MLFMRLFGITDQRYLNAISRASTIGLHMVSGIAVGAVIGFFVDRWLDSSPWGMGFFLVTGIIAGFKNVYLDTKRLVASQEQEEHAEHNKKKD